MVETTESRDAEVARIAALLPSGPTGWVPEMPDDRLAAALYDAGLRSTSRDSEYHWMPGDGPPDEPRCDAVKGLIEDAEGDRTLVAEWDATLPPLPADPEAASGSEFARLAEPIVRWYMENVADPEVVAQWVKGKTQAVSEVPDVERLARAFAAWSETTSLGPITDEWARECATAIAAEYEAAPVVEPLDFRDELGDALHKEGIGCDVRPNQHGIGCDWADHDGDAAHLIGHINAARVLRSTSRDSEVLAGHVADLAPIDLDAIEMRWATEWGESDDGQKRAWRNDVARLIDELRKRQAVREAVDEHPDAPTIEQWYEAFATVSGEEAATPEGRADIYRRFRAALLIAWTRTPPAILDRSSEAAPTPYPRSVAVDENGIPSLVTHYPASEAAPVVGLSEADLARAIHETGSVPGCVRGIPMSSCHYEQTHRFAAAAILARLTQTRTLGEAKAGNDDD